MKLVRGLQRGIAVMRELTRAQACSLSELNARTKLPKATLLRLLHTLEAEGIVWRSLGDGAYRYRASSLAVTQRFQRLAEVAAPHLTALQRKVLWPSDLVVRRGHFMQLVETTRGLSDLPLSRDRLGKQLDIVGSAIGRAYLAFCSEKERDSIIDYVVAHPEIRGGFGPVDRVELGRALEVARQRGFAARDPALHNPMFRPGRDDDHLEAIAVPIMASGRVIGCVNILWLRHLRLMDELVKNHLADLQATAAGIAVAMRSASARHRQRPHARSWPRALSLRPASAKPGPMRSR